MKGGYFMAEVKADLSKTAKQTITGVYNVAKKAVESEKAVIIHGLNYNGIKTTPVCAFGWLRNDDVYIFNASTFFITISEDDGVTVNNTASN